MNSNIPLWSYTPLRIEISVNHIATGRSMLTGASDTIVRGPTIDLTIFCGKMLFDDLRYKGRGTRHIPPSKISRMRLIWLKVNTIMIVAPWS
jgi:hypothetical protein